MKTLAYYIVAILLFGTITTGLINAQPSKNSILIQSIDKNISASQLSASADIIKGRLKNFSPDNFDVSIIAAKNQIKVIIPGSQDLKVISDLITHKGSIEFYETVSKKDLAVLLKGDNTLFTLLKSSVNDNPEAHLGCTAETEIEKINSYIKTLTSVSNCKFAWSQDFDAARICLYALKTNAGHEGILTNKDIEKAVYSNEKIDITVKKPAAGILAEATRRNMDKEIAIVLDNNVISAPRVRLVIESGKIEITGKFTNAGAGYMAALLSNGVLPVSFSVVK